MWSRFRGQVSGGLRPKGTERWQPGSLLPGMRPSEDPSRRARYDGYCLGASTKYFYMISPGVTVHTLYGTDLFRAVSLAVNCQDFGELSRVATITRSLQDKSLPTPFHEIASTSDMRTEPWSVGVLRFLRIARGVNGALSKRGHLSCAMRTFGRC
jgi:hypothetical protein